VPSHQVQAQYSEHSAMNFQHIAVLQYVSASGYRLLRVEGRGQTSLLFPGISRRVTEGHRTRTLKNPSFINRCLNNPVIFPPTLQISPKVPKEHLRYAAKHPRPFSETIQDTSLTDFRLKLATRVASSIILRIHFVLRSRPAPLR